MYAKSLFTLAFAFCAATTASADHDVYEASAIFAAGQGSAELNIPMPDSNRGMPLGMKVEMTVGLRGTAGIENTTKDKRHGVLFNDYGADVRIGKTPFRLAGGGQFALLHDFGAYDGKVEFSGFSGATFALDHSSGVRIGRIAGKALSRMLNAQDCRFITFDIHGGAASSLLGLDDSPHSERLFLAVQIRVTYIYKEKSDGSSPSKGPGSSGAASGGAKPIGTFGQTAPSVVPAVKPSALLPVVVTQP